MARAGTGPVRPAGAAPAAALVIAARHPQGSPDLPPATLTLVCAAHLPGEPVAAYDDALDMAPGQGGRCWPSGCVR